MHQALSYIEILIVGAIVAKWCDELITYVFPTGRR